ncbi:MAG: hypothetical protein RL173_743 [Fibrobacterota bacterium]|jgi:hypothetical protein
MRLATIVLIVSASAFCRDISSDEGLLLEQETFRDEEYKRADNLEKMLKQTQASILVSEMQIENLKAPKFEVEYAGVEFAYSSSKALFKNMMDLNKNIILNAPRTLLKESVVQTAEGLRQSKTSTEIMYNIMVSTERSLAKDNRDGRKIFQVYDAQNELMRPNPTPDFSRLVRALGDKEVEKWNARFNDAKDVAVAGYNLRSAIKDQIREQQQIKDMMAYNDNVRKLEKIQTQEIVRMRADQKNEQRRFVTEQDMYKNRPWDNGSNLSASRSMREVTSMPSNIPQPDYKSISLPSERLRNESSGGWVSKSDVNRYTPPDIKIYQPTQATSYSSSYSSGSYSRSYEPSFRAEPIRLAPPPAPIRFQKY